VAKITREEVQYVAALARLELHDSDIQDLTQQLGRILDYIDKLTELDTDDVEPTSHVIAIRNVVRPDEREEPLARDRALALAPEHQEGYYEVPRVVE
jgi:aspartyl-tRNA(Asn)/glutamyl-tRNA(Gln) amidotransferase subunit C